MTDAGGRQSHRRKRRQLDRHQPRTRAPPGAEDLDRTDYVPEQYPALGYRPTEAVERVQIYISGKLVLTGTTDPAAARIGGTTLADQLTDLGLQADERRC
jgi:hypothetical protein